MWCQPFLGLTKTVSPNKYSKRVIIMATKFKKKVLSIDGGGIRGIIPAMVLNYIENRTGRRIAEMFDLIAGTSTGGILALGLTRRNSDSEINNEPEYTAAELVTFYHKFGRKIFTENTPRIPGDDFLQPKFNSKYRQEVLEELLGEADIEDALQEVLITSYDVELRTPVFFTSNQNAEDSHGLDSRKVCTGFKMFQAAMATSAAPTFFQPYKLKTIHRTEEGYYALIDGGVLANNPSSLAMMEAMISHKRDLKEELQRDEMLVVSLGTGTLTRKYEYDDVARWGQLNWVLPLLNIVLDSQSESVAYQLQNLMFTNNVPEGKYRNYYRFQVPLSSEDGRDQMDNASPENIQELEELGNRLIRESKKSLDQLCSILED
jgi:uncharacterized protein